MILKYLKFLESLKNINDMWDVIPQSVKDLHDLFSDKGKKLYLVGGSVRDFLTGDKPKDFDLATDALPDEVLQIIGDKYKTNLQGKAFGVVVVYTKDQPEGMEIATFREDLYDDKIGTTRNPDVKFTSIEQDVLRRDLRINGLFYDLEKREIVDLVGGVEDIKNRTISMIGDPDLRIKEDPLRIMRVFRFSFRYGFEIDNKTKEAIKRNKKTLNLISRERIWEEIKKSYSYSNMKRNFENYLQFFTDFDMWDEVFPNSSVNTDLISSKDFIVVLANLFQGEDTSKLERKMVQDWKIETDLARPVIFLIDFMKLTPENGPDLFKQKMRCHIKDETIREWIQVKNLKDPIFEAFLKYRPSVSAEDLMAKGLKGKALGDTIRQMEIENFKKLI